MYDGCCSVWRGLGGRMMCSICDKPAVAKGYCTGHYQRAKAGLPMSAPLGGLPRPASRRTKSPQQFLVERINRNGPTMPHMGTPCWEWTGRIHKRDGYGIARSKTFYLRAHRLSWEVHVGPIPDGLHVLHHCDNKRCVRADHLYIGGDVENTADRVARGRVPRVCGARSPHAKLTDAHVVEIRRRFDAGERISDIAADMPVGETVTARVAHRKAWRHLPELLDSDGHEVTP